MSAAAHMNGTLCEAELFLASLHSEESDTDAYDLFNTPPNGGLDIPFSAKGAAGPVSLTPESLQSQIGFGMNSVGLDNTEFGNFVDVKDAEARARASSSTLAGMVKMETDNSKRGSNLLSVLDNTSKDISIVDAGLVDTSSVATGLGHSVGKVSKPKRERMSHNIIEKKYRTNINDKILQLREIVPALRVAAKREEGLPVTDEDHSKLDGLEPARKLNKASILIKTIEYIKHLETKCAVYRMENLQLKQNNGFSTPESVRQASHTVPFATSTTVSTQHSADLSSGSSTVTSPANFAQAYPHGYGSTDLSSKILLGGLALTMGATCFGENDDFGNARGLFAMPVFQYSPATNSLTFSNSHGVPVNFGSSMLSLMRLLLFLYAIFRFAMAVFVRSLPQRNEKQQEDSSSLGKLVQYSDTLVFGTPTGLWSSLKKCLFISRLKYPENTIERVESEIAKCFILKIYSSSSNMWKFICDRYAASTWAKLVKRVDAANSLAPKKGHYYGLEWEMITNIMNADIEKTLESCEILENLQKSGNLAYSLRDFIAMVNDSIVASNTIFITSLLMQELMEEPQSDLDYIVENIYDHELKQDKTLELARESFIVLNALFNSSESAAKELLTLMKLDEDIAMENVNKDQLFVLYSIVVRQHIAAGNYQRLLNYVSQIPLSYLNAKDCSLVGATAVYLVLRYLLKNEKQLQGDSTLCILEELASKLRVWFGSDAGNVLDLEVRGKLINYCVDVALQSNEKLAGDLSSSSSENENESDFELSHDEKIS